MIGDDEILFITLFYIKNSVERTRGPDSLDAHCCSSNFQKVVWENRSGSQGKWDHHCGTWEQLQHL